MLMTRFPGSLGVGEGGLEAVSVRWYRGPGFEADGSQLEPAAVRVRAPSCQLRPWLLPYHHLDPVVHSHIAVCDICSVISTFINEILIEDGKQIRYDSK